VNISIFLYLVKLAGCAILAFAPLDKRRIRAKWAKSLFVLIGVIGVISNVCGLMWERGQFTLGKSASYRFDMLLHLSSGLIIGFLLSLVFSGELAGKKLPPNTPDNKLIA
jgi:hypothetical protein